MPNGNKNGKVPVVGTIIGALCIILYIGALSYGALTIYNNVTERRTLGDREFEGLADLATAAGVLGFMDEKFIQTIQDAIDGSETVLGVVISGSRGEFAFERERGTVISWVNNSPRFVPRFAVTNPPKNLPLRIEGQRNVTIQAVSGYLDYDFCVEIIKRTLLVVLFSLTLAFFTLLMDALLAKNAARPGASKEALPAAGTPDAAAGPNTTVPAASAQTGQWRPAPALGEGTGPRPPEKKEQPAPAYKESPEAGVRETSSGGEPGEEGAPAGEWEDFDFDDDDDFPDFDKDSEEDKEESPVLPFVNAMESPAPAAPAVMESPAPAVPIRENPAAAVSAGEDPAAENAAPGPQGLFSPRGNVGWESYTEDRLESELHRCASVEQDLALFAITFTEPEKLGKEQFRRFCEEAVNCFEHRDLIFESGDQGLWVIRPNCSLEQGLAAAEEFNSRIFSRLPRPVGSKLDLRFGISSRAGRLIDAERIMMEAREALKRAAGDPASHIVAFKSDPEKYRQYISGRTLRSA